MCPYVGCGKAYYERRKLGRHQIAKHGKGACDDPTFTKLAIEVESRGLHGIINECTWIQALT